MSRPDMPEWMMENEYLSPLIDAKDDTPGEAVSVPDGGLRAAEASQNALGGLEETSRPVSPMENDHEIHEHAHEESALMGYSLDTHQAETEPIVTDVQINSEVPLPEPRLRNPTWIPLSLTYRYLLTVAGISFALGIACIILESISRANNGISNAGTGNGFAFSWRFLPTVLAVMYSLLWVPVMTDAIRTDPWALMSIQGGSKASESLLKTPGFWIVEAFNTVWKRKMQPGGIRWAVLLAISASMIGSLAINPLSAGLLNVEDLTFTKSQSFLSLAKPTSPPVSDVNDGTYLGSVAQLVYNLTTSAWLTEDYAVLPFWPSSLQSMPTGAQLVTLPQTWKGTTSVFKLGFNCELVTTELRYPVNSDNVTHSLQLDFESQDGCSGTVNLGQTTASPFWSSGSGLSTWGVFNNTDSCNWHDYLMICPPNVNVTETSQVSLNASPKVYVCSNDYAVANIPISMLTTKSNSTANINNGSFNANKQQMDSSFLDIDDFQNSFSSESGSYDLTYFSQFDTSSDEFIGPSMLLALQYNLSTTNMVEATDLVPQAQNIKQMFFGQALLSSFSSLAKAKTTSNVTGTVTITSSRLIVVNGFGFSLGTILLVLGVAAVFLPRLTNLRRRPLQLEHDPSTAAAAALLLEGSESSKCFENLDSQSEGTLEKHLENSVFFMSRGALNLVNSPLPALHHSPSHHVPSSNFKTKSKKLAIPGAKQQVDDWRPFGLRFLAATGFVIVLLLVMAALIAIYVVAKHSGLYESAFVYQKNISVAGYSITTLSPLSVIPTLIASIIKLWWAFFDDTFRRLTPFLSMVKKSQRPGYGAALSYITTPLIWVTVIAAKKRHWFLALVTLGAFTSEVLQVTMSALWTAESGVLKRNVVLNQEMEIRTVSHTFQEVLDTGEGGYHSLHPAVLAALNGDTSRLYDNWIYHGIVQAVANATPPAFSTAQWGFPPMDFSNVIDQVPIAKQAGEDVSSSVLGSNLNVTFNSPALSGRLECSPINETETQNIFTSVNLTDSLDLNVTANPKGLDVGYKLSDAYLNFVGLNQNTGSPPSSNFSLGLWIHNFSSSTNTTNEPQNNFSIIWFSSEVPQKYLGTGDEDPTVYWIFAEIPPITAINCNPIFEKVNAKVTIDVSDQSVQTYELMGSPQDAPEAWSDNYSVHYATPGNLTSSEPYWNETVSWGYLFMQAVLEATVADLDAETSVGFTFRENNLYMDFFSYAAYAMADYNFSAMQDAAILANRSSTAFSMFFQAWISLPNNEDGGYWAWQPLNATLPYGLDFELPQTSTVVFTNTYTSYVTSCEATATSVCATISSVVTEDVMTNAETVYPPTTGPGITFAGFPPGLYTTITTTSTAAASSQVPPTVVPFTVASSVTEPSVARRQVTQTAKLASSTPIPAVLSVRTEMLVVSPIAIWFSVVILAFLAISTVFVFVEQRRYIKLLPRDVDSPASILAFVYASKKLQAWARERHENGEWDDSEGSRISFSRLKDILSKPKKRKIADEHTEVGMGPFPCPDFNHWGVEVDAAPARMSLLHPESYPSHMVGWRQEEKSSTSSNVKHASSSTSTTLQHLPPGN